jgi:hypothetical protein
MYKMMICDGIYNYFYIFTDTEGRDSVSAMNPIYAYGHEFSKHLAQGLADNWSQVSKYLELNIYVVIMPYCIIYVVLHVSVILKYCFLYIFLLLQ